MITKNPMQLKAFVKRKAVMGIAGIVVEIGVFSYYNRIKRALDNYLRISIRNRKAAKN